MNEKQKLFLEGIDIILEIVEEQDNFQQFDSLLDCVRIVSEISQIKIIDDMSPLLKNTIMDARQVVVELSKQEQFEELFKLL